MFPLQNPNLDKWDSAPFSSYLELESLAFCTHTVCDIRRTRMMVMTPAFD